ncbi:hypothetical protein J7T55_010913 [Diaporthe amygdali]|uniref:uncharacterized protein n=1 Tax=Phomopsis amygdali TaxID=1214568 RepID=UPI0022FEB44C|nr:uncharacterized protein J7T55_010913 [Diaporthe amygdali]KAJ0104447.1 hypothetical protein J7T55_010913 [Diaporthe amygdali]
MDVMDPQASKQLSGVVEQNGDFTQTPRYDFWASSFFEQSASESRAGRNAIAGIWRSGLGERKTISGALIRLEPCHGGRYQDHDCRSLFKPDGRELCDLGRCEFVPADQYTPNFSLEKQPQQSDHSTTGQQLHAMGGTTRATPSRTSAAPKALGRL